jgi:hypothetical protein
MKRYGEVFVPKAEEFLFAYQSYNDIRAMADFRKEVEQTLVSFNRYDDQATAHAIDSGAEISQLFFFFVSSASTRPSSTRPKCARSSPTSSPRTTCTTSPWLGLHRSLCLAGPF